MNNQQNDPVAEALKRFFEAFPPGPLGIEEVGISECNRRIVAVDVKASTDLPPFSRALVEGYLVNVQDMAGAGKNKEPQGCEQKKGEVIVGLGTRLSPKEIMLLASQGVSSVTVSRKPIVAIFSTGNEILRHSEPLKPGYVWDANSYTLAALVEDCGGMPLVVDIMKDDLTTFQKALRGGLTRVDMAVISGGTAAGGREFIAELINSIDDPGVVVNGVSMKSGKPLIMGVLSDKPIVCVAGYPPEAIRGFELFWKPTINRLLGVK